MYWITGKAGSGKSTLIKFIQSDPRTFELFRGWAETNRLVIASHFFWSSGKPMQKSQDGLLRTLLYQIFSQSSDLVPRVFGGQWHDNTWNDFSWTRAELLGILKRVAALSPLSLRICLFVDGLDEYNGDHPQLVKIFNEIVQSPNFKICVASRPWNDFLDNFKGSPWKLYVQDLTYNDIRLYQGQS
jgi:hypothetical protein